MLKIFVSLVFLAGIIWNYSITRKNIVRIKKKIEFILIIAIFAMVAFYLCYRFDHSLLGYCVSISAVAFAFTFIFTPGISKEGVNLFLGTTALIKHVKFDEIKDVRYKDISENAFALKIDVFGKTYHQIYRMEDKDRVADLITNF